MDITIVRNAPKRERKIPWLESGHARIVEPNFLADHEQGDVRTVQTRQKKESTRRYKKNGPQRKIGSIDKCERCGKEYVVSGGRQKYCDECKKEALLEWQRPRKREYNKMTNQKEKKKERRRATEKVCVYCGRKFSTTTTTTLCSDYCRGRQQKYRQCINDINRGHKRRLDILEKEREEYREEVKKNQ